VEQAVINVSRETRGEMLKWLKLNFLHYLTKIIWWFREKVVSLQYDKVNREYKVVKM
jgi:hypothetical protein